MSKRLTIEFIRNEFEKENYQLLTKEYKTKQKLEYICPEGHKGTIQWSSWQSGSRCAECVGLKKKTIEFIESEFEKDGYQLLTTEYKNAKQKLEYICPKGHRGTIRWRDWQSGRRCRQCAVDATRMSFDIIKESFEKEGYQLLTTEYKNNEQKLEYICSKGHRGSIRWDSWQQGYRCQTCRRKRKLILIKLEFEKEGYKLLTTEYKNNAQKLVYICPQGHRGSITWCNWQSGSRCRQCAIDKTRISFDIIKESFEKEGYQLLTTEYKNNAQKLVYICPQGHRGSITWNGWKQGNRCSICARQSSKAELELYNFVKQYFPDTLHNDRRIIRPKELDIVVPDKKIAIEYCGIYWHSELAGGKTKNYHLDKLNRTAEKGYKLITIFEDEYINHPDIVKDKLKIILGISDGIKVNIRKCTVKELDTNTARKFCNKYHLQGYGNSKIKLGAYLDNKLLSVMTFSVLSSDAYELDRLCFKTGYNINMRDASSKLLKYFIRNYKPATVTSSVNKRWANGRLYNVLGFKHTYDSFPNYYYIFGLDRIHKFNFRKSVLKNTLEKFDSKLSEWQNMINNGYDRIWDCGNMKFVLNLN